jgi:hypothetical protein
MPRRSSSRSDGRSTSLTRLKKAASRRMTVPNLLAAGGIALGAAAFAYLRDEQRRNTLLDTAGQWREKIPGMGHDEQTQSEMQTPQIQPALP